MPDRKDTFLDDEKFRVLAWLGILLQIAALLFVIWSQRWNGLWSIGIMLALSLAFMLMKEHVPSFVSMLVVAAAIVNAGGWAWNWFNQIVWYDEFVHLFTSFAVMSAIACASWARGWLDAPPGTGSFVLWVTAVGFGLGVLWEVGEWIVISITWSDTIVDLVLDTIGAAAAGWFAGWVVRRNWPARAAAAAA